MKYILIIAAICFATSLYAQQPFQGRIVYSIKTSEKIEGELTAMFAPNKIKLWMKQEKGSTKTGLLIDLDSAKMYEIDTTAGTYKATNLSIEANEILETKVIAGYTTIPSKVNSVGRSALLTAIQNGSITYYTSKDLYFPIDQKFSGNPQLVLVHDNHIVLGAKIIVRNPFREEEDTMGELEKQITAEAILVQPGVVSTKEFIIPEGYTKKKLLSYQDFQMTDSTGIADSSMMTMDTTALAPTQPVPKSKQKPAPKKQAPSKGEAIKRKKS